MATDWFYYWKEMLTSATSKGLLTSKLSHIPVIVAVNTKFLSNYPLHSCLGLLGSGVKC